MRKEKRMNKNWEVRKLGDIAEVIAGQSPKGIYYNKERVGLPFYQGKKEFTDKYIGAPSTWTTNVTREAYKDDILMSVRAPVGPVNFSTQTICIGRGLAVIRAGNILNKEFLFYFLIKHESEIEQSQGAVFNSINKKQIESITIPLPPLSEQHRIVSILDQSFAAIDQAISRTQRNLNNAKEIFESYLNRVFEEKGEDWEEKKLEGITSKIGSGATPRGGQANYKTEGISMIRSMNIHDLKFEERNLAFIDDKQASNLNNVILQQYDVLINITGASIARCCVLPEEYLPARVNQHVSIIRPLRNIVDPYFLSHLLVSKAYKKKLLDIGNKGATRQAITKAEIEKFKISFPNLVKQQLIVEKLESLQVETQRLEAIYRQKLKSLKELKKSMLEMAFRGEL